MKCPKCDSEMEILEFNDIEVDKCTGCEGIWFDNLEYEELKNMKGSDVIDTGDPTEGAQNDHIDDYPCPKCGGKMVKMVDKAQPHIWYEQCHACFGVYFDAGEFRDYKNRSLFDYIGDIFVKERK